MARPPRNYLDTVPAVFMEIARACALGVDIPPLPMASRNAAISARHRFYKFRIAMIQQQHEHGAALADLMLSIAPQTRAQPEGAWFVHFNRLGLGDAPRAAREAAQTHERAITAQELLDRPFDEIPDAPDHTEDAVEAYLRGDIQKT
jgi:hypothetical protein